MQLEKQQEQTENTTVNTQFFVKCSIVLIIFFLLIGAWYSLIFSIPAIVFAIRVSMIFQKIEFCGIFCINILGLHL